jgi:SIR2-like protein
MTNLNLNRTSRPKAGGKSVEDPAAVAESFVSRIYEDILRGSCVIFVGAGSTTERRRQGTPGFYDQIKEKSGYPADMGPPSFPALMQYFCDHVDGGRHNRLITEAIARIEHFCAHGEEKWLAMSLSESIAEIPYLNRFVTTNWDPFLERALDVLVPMVEDRDLAFWDDRKRQVLKIHGCITRPYSVVATQSDYDACMRRNPLIFNKLKDLMATKTFLFVGYSMRDADFQEVWNGITAALGHFTKFAYAVDIDATPDAVSFWKERGIQLVKTSDILFVRSLRGRLEKGNLIPSERLLGFLRRAQRQITSTHIKMGQESHGKFASAMYQDGLLHALDDVLTSTALGVKNKEDFESDLSQANEALEQVRGKHDPIEIAYFTGRVEVLKRFCRRSTTPILRYLHPYRLRPSKKLVRGDKL